MNMNIGLKRESFIPAVKIIILVTVLFFASHALAEEAKLPDIKIDLGKGSIKRGEELFQTNCNLCHGLKYLGYHAKMDPVAAKTAFGTEPPDLSLMAKARGKGDEGARYIYALLISYNDTPEKNSVFPNIAMPPVISKDDPQFEQKARDVSAFLLYAAEPTTVERRELGRYVMVYMVILTALLYLLNKRTWKDIKKKG